MNLTTDNMKNDTEFTDENPLLSDGRWAEFKKHRGEFTVAFKDVGIAKVNAALNANPENTKDGKDGQPRLVTDWANAPLKAAAAHYARMRLGLFHFPVLDIPQLKQAIGDVD